METVRPLTWFNVIGYGLGDVANNFAFALGALFLLHYYTDVAGLSAAAAGTLLVLVRIYDAFMDVIAGRVIDRTISRWGRFRPFLLWSALPLLLMSVAVFSVPANWTSAQKLVYAYVTYAILGTAYSFVNIPYGSLATVMTQEPRERALLGAMRTLMATGTFAFLALAIAPKIRHAANPQELQAHLTEFTLILAVVGMALYCLCFKATREIVQREIERPGFKSSLNTLRYNRPLLMLCISALCLHTGLFSQTATALYFARYVLGDVSLFIPIIVISSFLSVLVAAPLTPLLVKCKGKKNTFLLGISIGALSYFLLFFAPTNIKFLPFILLGAASIGAMIAMSVMWALEADTVEFGEWVTGIRIEGMTYAIFSFSRKCGQALGGSIPAFLLAASGYMPNALTQSDATRLGILGAIAFVPGVAFAIAFVLMYFYPLTDVRFAKLVQEIRDRQHPGYRAQLVSDKKTASSQTLPR
ncbi:MAG: glucuronide transporter [Formivibrio sp.]|nr:glucuronide transporter [Formivibrio sp.]